MKIPKPLLQKFREDPRLFFKFLKVFDKEQQQLLPFVLNDEQEILLDALLQHNRIVVCKARQIGCSTLIRAYNLWKSYCEPQPTTHAIISYTRDSADHLHSIDKQFYLGLPGPLQRKLSKSSSRTLKFADTGAELRAFTGGGKGGATRSFTFSSAHISEFAFFDDQSDLLANVIASVGEGQVIIETTPNGPGDTYHRLCMGAPHNGWHICFFPWFQHKKYKKPSMFGQNGVPPMDQEEKRLMKELKLQKQQMYWRRTQISTMGEAKFRREFPSSVDEAFMSNDKVFFPIDLVDNLEVLDLGSNYDMHYSDPVEGERYAMGVDVAHGNGGDYSTITVVSTTTFQPVYHYKRNTVLPADFADVVWNAYHEWGEPFTIVESNGPGALVLYRLKEFGVRNLYEDRGRDWTTRKENKVAIYDNLRELICDGTICTIEQGLWSEIRNTITEDKGAPKHPKGHHDDVLISFCLALWGAKLNPAPSIYSVREQMMEQFLAKTRARRIRARGPIPFRRRGQ